MKLSVKLAGLCGSAAFIITALPGFYQQAKPTDFAQMATDILPGVNIIENVLMSLGAALGAGFIGYTMGDILSNPKGRKKGKAAKLKKEIEISGEADPKTDEQKVAQISASSTASSPTEAEIPVPEASAVEESLS